MLNAARHPLRFIGYMTAAYHLRYLLELFRPGLFGALANPLVLLAVPVLLVNLLARGAGTASLELHYNVYVPPVLMTAAVATWLHFVPRLARVARASAHATRIAVASLVLIVTLVGLPCVFGRSQLAAYVPPPHLAEIRSVLARIPAEASVAAPRYMAHALAQREELYLVNRWAEYARYDPEYVIVETDFSYAVLNDGTLESYQAYARALAEDPALTPILAQSMLILYRKKADGASATVEAGQEVRSAGEAR